VSVLESDVSDTLDKIEQEFVNGNVGGNYLETKKTLLEILDSKEHHKKKELELRSY